MGESSPLEDLVWRGHLRESERERDRLAKRIDDLEAENVQLRARVRELIDEIDSLSLHQ